MLELYWAFADVDAFIAMLEELIASVAAVAGDDAKTMFTTPFPRVTFRQAIIDDCGIDIDAITTSNEMIDAVKKAKLPSTSTVATAWVILRRAVESNRTCKNGHAHMGVRLSGRPKAARKSKV